MSDYTGLIERAALGRSKELGSLYDATNDIFCGLSILEDLPAVLVEESDSPMTKTVISMGDNLTENFKNLEVCAELSINVLSGLVKLEGSGKLLQSSKSSKKEARATMLFHVTTKTRKLNIMNNKVSFAMDAFNEPTATHVVIEIMYGANAVLNVSCANENNESVTAVEGKMKATLDRISGLLSAEASVQGSFNNDEKNSWENYKCDFFGDVLPLDGQKMPTNIVDAVDWIRNIYAMAKQANGGKGVPLKYTLMPLSSEPLQKRVGYHPVKQLLVEPVGEEYVNMLVDAFQHIRECRHDVNDWITDIKKLQRTGPCVDRQTIDDMDGFMHAIENEESKLKDKLKQMMQDVRSKKKGPSDVASLCGDAIALAREQQDKCQNIYDNTARFAKRCMKFNVKFLSDPDALDDEIDQRKHVFVLIGHYRALLENAKDGVVVKKSFFQIVHAYNRTEANKECIPTFIVYGNFYNKSSAAGDVSGNCAEFKIQEFRNGRNVRCQGLNMCMALQNSFDSSIPTIPTGLKEIIDPPLGKEGCANQTINSFDDRDKVGNTLKYVTGMDIGLRKGYGSYIVGGLRIFYNTGDQMSHGIGSKRDHPDGYLEFRLEEGECIVNAKVFHGFVVDSLQFDTNHGRSMGPYGGGGGGENRTTLGDPRKSRYLSCVKGRVDVIGGITAVRFLELVWNECA